ncbi:hypothetical protein, partial [Chromohalobacter sp. HP20-39]|uniref:hypothetical protein n=1 Tax=Chromohalobacter sp. HP20-39 TaxID=3079306 RepID=UPI00294B5829
MFTSLACIRFRVGDVQSRRVAGAGLRRRRPTASAPRFRETDFDGTCDPPPREIGLRRPYLL